MNVMIILTTVTVMLHAKTQRVHLNVSAMPDILGMELPVKVGGSEILVNMLYKL
jgi:hypothetical protein